MHDVVESIDLTKYNGEVTLYNTKTGGHCTVSIKTAKRGGLKGQRIVSEFIGNDNENPFHYQGFGIVADNGLIRLWKRANEKQRKLSVLLCRQEDYSHFIHYSMAIRCRRCNRKLTNPESIESGIGPECRKNA